MAAFYILASIIFLGFLASGTTGPFFPLYAASLGGSLADIALVVGTFSATNLIASLWWGRVADRIGRRKPLLVGAMGTLVLTNLLISQAGVWWVLLPLRLVEGVAIGAYGVANLAMMGDILEGHPHRARLIGAYRMSGSLAFSIAIVVAGLVAQTSGFHTTYTVASGIYFVAFAISLFLPEHRTAAASAGARARTSFAELARGPMLPLMIVAASFSLPFAAVYSMWPVWVADGLGLGRATFSQLWGLAAFVEVPCMALAGFATDRFGRRLTFGVGLVLFACVYLLYLNAPALGALLPPVVLEWLPASEAPGRSALPVLIVAQVVRGFAFAAFTATALTMAIEVAPPAARGRSAGLFQMAQSLSGIVGSYLGGPIAQGVGYLALFAGAAATVLSGAVYTLVTLRTSRPGDPAGPGEMGLRPERAARSR